MEVTFDGEGGRRRIKAAFRLNRLAGLRNAGSTLNAG
jgi:hypothetical protein